MYPKNSLPEKITWETLEDVFSVFASFLNKYILLSPKSLAETEQMSEMKSEISPENL